MNRRNIFRLTVLVAFCGLAACSNDTEDDLKKEENGDSNGDGCQTEEISYNNGISAVLSENCTLSGCHDGSSASAPDMTDYEGAKTYADNGRIEERVLEREDMPPAEDLDDCSKEKIAEWLAAGAPE